MLDHELSDNKHLQNLFENSFTISSILPTGKLSLFSHIEGIVVPYLGPNWYITKPCAYTAPHVDGYVSQLISIKKYSSFPNSI